MTIIMFILAFGVRTPIFLWGIAMLCDTLLLMTFMLLRAKLIA